MKLIYCDPWAITGVPSGARIGPLTAEPTVHVANNDDDMDYEDPDPEVLCDEDYEMEQEVFEEFTEEELDGADQSQNGTVVMEQGAIQDMAALVAEAFVWAFQKIRASMCANKKALGGTGL